MGYLTFFINRIALGTDGYATMDFYNSEDHAGTSYVPFIGFMLFLIGLVVIIVGAATYFTATRNFNIFYDTRDVKITYDEQMMSDDEKAKLAKEILKKDKKRGQITMIVGAVLVIASFIVLLNETPSAGEADGERGRRAVYLTTRFMKNI